LLALAFCSCASTSSKEALRAPVSIDLTYPSTVVRVRQCLRHWKSERLISSYQKKSGEKGSITFEFTPVAPNPHEWEDPSTINPLVVSVSSSNDDRQKSLVNVEVTTSAVSLMGHGHINLDSLQNENSARWKAGLLAAILRTRTP